MGIRRSIVATGGVLAAALSMLTTSSASAVETPELSDGAVYVATADGPTATTTRTITTDPLCEQARADAGEPGQCAAEVTSGVDAEHKLTPEEIARVADMRMGDDGQGQSIGEAAAAGYTIYARSWWQEKHGLYYINWKERHEGSFWYNKHNAMWSKRHECDLGYGIGYDVDVKSCIRYGVRPGSVDNYDKFRVSVFIKGYPVYTTKSMTARTWLSGSIQFFG